MANGLSKQPRRSLLTNSLQLQALKPVRLVDANLRRPLQHPYLGLNNGEGLGSLLPASLLTENTQATARSITLALE